MRPAALLVLTNARGEPSLPRLTFPRGHLNEAALPGRYRVLEASDIAAGAFKKARSLDPFPPLYGDCKAGKNC
jgi:hypothetical protein